MKNMIFSFFAFAFALLSGSAFAAGETGMAAIFAAVDLTSVATWVAATGVLVVGIALGFKGIDLSKRGIKKA